MAWRDDPAGAFLTRSGCINEFIFQWIYIHWYESVFKTGSYQWMSIWEPKRQDFGLFH